MNKPLIVVQYSALRLGFDRYLSAQSLPIFVTGFFCLSYHRLSLSAQMARLSVEIQSLVRWKTYKLQVELFSRWLIHQLMKNTTAVTNTTVRFLKTVSLLRLSVFSKLETICLNADLALQELDYQNLIFIQNKYNTQNSNEKL